MSSRRMKLLRSCLTNKQLRLSPISIFFTSFRNDLLSSSDMAWICCQFHTDAFITCIYELSIIDFPELKKFSSIIHSITLLKYIIILFPPLSHSNLSSSYSLKYPLILRANCISFGIIVTRLPCIAHKLQSSNNPTR